MRREWVQRYSFLAGFLLGVKSSPPDMLLALLGIMTQQNVSLYNSVDKRMNLINDLKWQQWVIKNCLCFLISESSQRSVVLGRA